MVRRIHERERKFMSFYRLAVAIVGVLVLGAFASLGTRSVHAATFTIQGQALGRNEVPVCTSSASAFVRFTWDNVANQMSYNVTVSGLSPDQVTGSHFHRGSSAVAGPIIYPLSTVGFTQISGVVNWLAADVPDLLAGNFYFNVHSKECPGGFARLQVILPAAAAPGAAAPAPAAAAPAPAAALPRTGTANSTSGTSTDFIVLAGLLAITLGGAGVVAFRRS
jgi:hypothetical protein